MEEEEEGESLSENEEKVIEEDPEEEEDEFIVPDGYISGEEPQGESSIQSKQKNINQQTKTFQLGPFLNLECVDEQILEVLRPYFMQLIDDVQLPIHCEFNSVAPNLENQEITVPVKPIKTINFFFSKALEKESKSAPCANPTQEELCFNE